MTVEKLVKVLKQAVKNGQGQEEVCVETFIDGLKHELELDMYHCEREVDYHHYNMVGKVRS